MSVLLVNRYDLHAGRQEVGALIAKAVDDVGQTKPAVFDEGRSLGNVATAAEMSRDLFDTGQRPNA